MVVSAGAAAVMAVVSSAQGQMSGVGTAADASLYTNPVMASGAPGPMTAATATAAAAGGEPMKRQRGRFKVRDLSLIHI